MQMEQVHRDVRNKGITSNKVRYETGLRQHRDRLVRSEIGRSDALVTSFY